MRRLDLSGRLILVVEDELIQALNIGDALEHAGATVAAASTIRRARMIIAERELSAAVLDHQLPDGPADELCGDLTVRGLPFVLCTATHDIDGACSLAPRFHKPVDPDQITAKLASMLQC